MARSESEPIFFIPGYGEGRDTVQPFTAELAEQTGREVLTADFYRRGDRRLREDGQLDSYALALRAGKQFGFEGVPTGHEIVSHSLGARVASHFRDKPAEVQIAPEGYRAGGPMLGVRFAADVLKRTVYPGTEHEQDRKFARQQVGRIIGTPKESYQLAMDMMIRGEAIGGLLARRALVLMPRGDNVISFDTVQEATRDLPAVTFRPLTGAGHYVPFEHPEPIARIVADYLAEH